MENEKRGRRGVTPESQVKKANKTVGLMSRFCPIPNRVMQPAEVQKYLHDAITIANGVDLKLLNSVDKVRIEDK